MTITLSYRPSLQTSLNPWRRSISDLIERRKKKLRCSDNGINSSKITVIYNSFAIQSSISVNNKIDNKLAYDFDFIFSYFGTFGVSQSIIDLLDIFDKLKYTGIGLLLIGHGSQYDKIKQVGDNITNVVLIESMPVDKLESYYNISDVCIVKLRHHNGFKYTLPSKVLTIMSKKKPVVYLGPKGEASRLIEKTNCGWTIHDGDPNKIANEFRTISNASEKIKKRRL